jgi:hypothetical protein
MSNKYLAISVIYSILLSSISVTSFSPQVPIVDSPKYTVASQQPLMQPLHLHPDQAQELEAAASEVFSQKKQDEDDPDDTIDEPPKYHDDTKHEKESPLSAASATSSSSLKEKGSWSKNFFGFISRNRGK